MVITLKTQAFITFRYKKSGVSYLSTQSKMPKKSPRVLYAAVATKRRGSWGREVEIFRKSVGTTSTSGWWVDRLCHRCADETHDECTAAAAVGLQCAFKKKRLCVADVEGRPTFWKNCRPIKHVWSYTWYFAFCVTTPYYTSSCAVGGVEAVRTPDCFWYRKTEPKVCRWLRQNQILQCACVVFTLNRSFSYPTSVHPLSVLILHPREIRYKLCGHRLWDRKTKNNRN